MAANGNQTGGHWRNSNTSPNRADRYSAPYAGYCYSYVDADVDKLYTGIENIDLLIAWMEDRIADGYKVVLGLRKDGQSAYAELHDMDIFSPYAGWRLSAFADSQLGALSYLRFKYDVAFKDGWITQSPARDRATRG